ncbi:zinc transporter ZupT [Ravibacter arvi]|uniref:Zinc transporter ZupT n=1 Tax=Ravibacter arvi TaxID=2051041 RepID=A0ABP8LQX6_9BACT
MEQPITTAFLLTLLAGISTGIGSGIALMARKTNTRFLCVSLGFSAGVMLYVSFMELLPQSLKGLAAEWGEKAGTLYMLLSFFGGIALIALIDLLVPPAANPHEVHGVEDMHKKTKLKRVGTVVALSIAIHNFPEGIATFTSALVSLEIAIPIAVAIAIHNIPEGIAVAVPIYHSTGSRSKAFWYSFASGLAEPIGALIAYLFLLPFWSATINGIVLAAVAGIMIFISLDELLPTAEKFGEHHLAIWGMIAGMLLMAGSLYLFI